VLLFEFMKVYALLPAGSSNPRRVSELIFWT